MTSRLTVTMVAAGLSLTLAAATAQANLVTNGNFLSSSNGDGQLGYNTIVTDWAVPNPNPPGYLSYAFLFSPGSADNGTGVPGIYGNVGLWGTNNNGLGNIDAPVPGGGNYIGEDGGFQVGALSQTINGLTPGNLYTLRFAWAAAQQQYFYGDTTEYWTVDFGAETNTTSTIAIPSQGFSGWQQASFTFTADSTSDLLSFIATGTPSGVPPFALLTDVSLNAAVPEPASLILFASGIAGVASIARHRRKSATSAPGTPAS